jgi:hypothetical protein
MTDNQNVIAAKAKRAKETAALNELWNIFAEGLKHLDPVEYDVPSAVLFSLVDDLVRLASSKGVDKKECGEILTEIADDILGKPPRYVITNIRLAKED